MYIQPQTNIKLLHNVPLDDTYDHTIYFASASAQYTYFASLTKYNLVNYTYQRVQKGVARVGYKADLLYDCNYMMFQNTSFGSKWFYAFITKVEYVNNECSDVYFEIDVMQTWFFDFELEHCFVEREHCVDDTIGEHIEPESVATGEYVYNSYQEVVYLDDLVTIVAVNEHDTGGHSGMIYDGIYGAATLYVYNADDYLSINALIHSHRTDPESIIAIYCLPKFCIGNSLPSNHIIPTRSSSRHATVELPKIQEGMMLDGYQPKNNKLYTYPYNFICVDNSNGSSMVLRYEYFKNLTPMLQVWGTINQPIQIQCRPCEYKNITGNDGDHKKTLNSESISLTNFPICTWSVDSYQAWISQSAVPNFISTTGSLLQAGVSARPSFIKYGGNIPMAVSAIGSVSQVLQDFYKASIAADITKGSTNCGSVNCTKGRQQFYYGRCSVDKRIARIIDDYFNMYGYATNRVKIPNTHSRPHWNYVKTIGCCVTGSIPADDMRKICEIHDNGITYWKNGYEIGGYNLDNRPT